MNDSSTGSESDDELDSSDLEDSDDEDDDLDSNGMDEDDDLALAQFLQRRADLGLDVSDLDEIMDLDDFLPHNKSNKSKSSKRKSKILPDPHTGFFPSATATADQFDLMDWSRPSIAKPAKKSKKSKPSFNISDSELENNLLASWDNDRNKKKTRKAERASLRAQGLLTPQAKKHGKPDLDAKYKGGMTLTDAFEEIRQFMLRDHDALPFPPMDKHARKMIHEASGKLFLKSKSVGAGHKRFCTLIKTKRSSVFEGDEESIDSDRKSVV